MDSLECEVIVMPRLSTKGYVIRKDTMDPKIIQSIRMDLTVKPNVNPNQVGANQVEPYPVFLESANNLYLPRFYAIEHPNLGPLTPKFPNVKECLNLETTMTLRDYQMPIITKTLDVLQNGVGGGVLELYTGSGKTSIAIYLMCALKVKTLIIVHKSFLLQQWVERIQQFAPKVKIGVIQGPKADIVDKDVVIGMLQTLSMKDLDPELFKEFGFMVCDEVHHVAAEVFCRALSKICCRYMLGLSATPNRKDGLTKVIHWFIGPTAYSLQRDGSGSQKVIVKKITIASTEATSGNPGAYKYEVRNFRGIVQLPTMITHISEYGQRNMLIVHEVLYYVREPGRQVMVISDRINHLEILRDMIRQHASSKDLVIGFYTGRQKQKELQESEKANIILSSYAMCREGLDIQSLNTILLATSTGDVVQTCGRILRKVHDVSPLVIDIVDTFSSFATQSKKRDTFYKKSQYMILSKTWTLGGTCVPLEESSEAMLIAAAESTSKKNSTKTIQEDSDDDEGDYAKKLETGLSFIDDDD